MTRNKGITIHLVNLTSFMSFFAKWLALSCYRHCTVHTSESSQITVLNGGGFGLAPLGYWLCLAWHRLGLAVNGYGLAIAAWLWPLGSWLWLCLAWRRLGLANNPLGLGYGGRLIWLLMAMAAWAWLWRPLDLAINGYGLGPLG